MMFVFAHNLLGWADGSWEEEQRSVICDIYIDANFSVLIFQDGELYVSTIVMLVDDVVSQAGIDFFFFKTRLCVTKFN